MHVSAYKDIFDKNSQLTISVDKALERIKTGEKSKPLVYQIRGEKNKDKRDKLKQKLVCITFSGKFSERKDECLIQHSGFMCLDFDYKTEAQAKDRFEKMKSWPYSYAVWISPSGNGVKVLVKVKHPEKHREHFQSLQQVFPDIDGSGINVSRVCYESYDPEIHINQQSQVWERVYEEPKVVREVVKKPETDEYKIYEKIKVWLEGRGDAFVTGERNTFIFKLASACCRFGIDQYNAEGYIHQDYLLGDTTFSQRELSRTIASAYRSNAKEYGKAQFDTDDEVYIVTKTGEALYTFPDNIMDSDYKPTDVIYGEDVWTDAERLYDNGYEGAESCHIPPLDDYFKWKRRQVSGITGIGNYGKSAMWQYLAVTKALRDNNKFAVFGPENFPPEEWYFELTEMLMGTSLTPENKYRPTKEQYKRAYDFIREHFYYVYPQTLAPTPSYIKSKFLELIVKHGVSGVTIDPFNTMTNDYTKHGGRDDKYLESFLGDAVRFANDNNVYFHIIAHPHKMQKAEDGNYKCPDKYDMAGGAMWDNKLHNLFAYHRPVAQTEPLSSRCEWHALKVKKQKLFKRGSIEFDYDFTRRRFVFTGIDYLNYNNEFNHEYGYKEHTDISEPPF